ncbi:hypothetical protein PspKH34_34610 [Parageobacillus sp. KH3-4]|jgi:hypothetical protein|nr:hypothetical protein PspKH34_34610 [Parageobacillus sp. KH3-4]
MISNLNNEHAWTIEALFATVAGNTVCDRKAAGVKKSLLKFYSSFATPSDYLRFIPSFQ